MATDRKITKKAVPPKATRPSADLSGKWINELKSTMTLKVSGQNVSGAYHTAVSAKGKPLPGHPIVGSCDGGLISFVVNWTDRDAITAWVGQLLSPDKIFTMWQMTVGVEDPKKDYWESIQVGTDTFKRVK